MAEKIKHLGLERDYSKYLYFIDKDGSVARKSKSGEGSAEVVVPHAVQREKGYLYFLDKDGDLARSERSAGGKKKTDG
jgi:hypothetical protein